MASILDEYEDSLSRSAVLQPGCPSVAIPHSGKALLASAGEVQGGRPHELTVIFRICFPDSSLCSALLVLGWLWGRSLKALQKQPLDLGPVARILFKEGTGTRIRKCLSTELQLGIWEK